jgi:hypothetical protein
VKNLFLISLLFIQYNIVKAGYGYTTNCGVTIELNNKTYALGNCNNATYKNFNATPIGALGAFTINKIEQHTYETGVDNVTNATMYYRIYTGNLTTTFNSVNLTTIYNLNNGEEKREALPSIDLMLNLLTNTTYNFEIYFESQLSNGTIFKYDNNGANFKTTFSTPNILPVKLSSFLVSTQNTANQVRWTTASEHDLLYFKVYRSNNGNNWSEIGTVNALNSASGTAYSFNDNSPLNGNNYYRIISYSLNGEQTYSKIIRNFFGKIDNSLSLYPNPTVDYLKVNFVSNIRGQYVLDMYNDVGQRLYQQSFTHNAVDRTISIDLPKSMKKGPYRILISNGSEFYIGTFIVQ